MHRVSFAAMPQTHFVTRFVLDLGWSWCVHVNCLVRSVLSVFESVIEYDWVALSDRHSRLSSHFFPLGFLQYFICHRRLFPRSLVSDQGVRFFLLFGQMPDMLWNADGSDCHIWSIAFSVAERENYKGSNIQWEIRRQSTVIFPYSPIRGGVVGQGRVTCLRETVRISRSRRSVTYCFWISQGIDLNTSARHLRMLWRHVTPTRLPATVKLRPGLLPASHEW